MNQDKLNNVIALCNSHKFDDARNLLDEIIAEDKNYSEAWRLAAQIDLNEYHEVDKAYDELIESLRLTPQNLWALLLMGNLLLEEKKDPKTAKEYYDKVLEYHPDNAVALNNIGAAYAGNDNYDDALIFFAKSLEADDTYANAYYGMAAAYFNAGEYRKCFETCHKAVFKCVVRPEDPNVSSQIFSAYVSSAKKLADSYDYDALIKDIASKLEKVDHLPIEYKEDHDPQVTAKLLYGPLQGELHHTIVYNPDKDYAGYQILHQLIHLWMLQRNTIAHKGKVLMATWENKETFAHEYADFFNCTYHCPDDELKGIMDDVCEGIGGQILNTAFDLFTDELIYREYRDLRPVQFLMMLTENEAYAKASKPEVTKMIPEDVASSNVILNLAFSLHLREMYGINGIGAYKHTQEELNVATDMYNEFLAYLKTFKIGDEYNLVDYFGDSVDMRDFYTVDDEIKYTADFNKKKAKAESEHRDDYADSKNAGYALEHQDGANPQETMMMAMYMETAMEHCDNLGEKGTEKLARECAMTGYHGISPSKEYTLHMVSEKPMNGYAVIAFYYVSFARRYPKILPELGLPYTKAYSMALNLYNKKKNRK